MNEVFFLNVVVRKEVMNICEKDSGEAERNSDLPGNFGEGKNLILRKKRKDLEHLELSDKYKCLPVEMKSRTSEEKATASVPRNDDINLLMSL